MPKTAKPSPDHHYVLDTRRHADPSQRTASVLL